MAALTWLAAPMLAAQLTGPTALRQALILAITGGLIWQCALVLILLRREKVTLRWASLRDALWLHARVHQRPVDGIGGSGCW